MPEPSTPTPAADSATPVAGVAPAQPATAPTTSVADTKPAAPVDPWKDYKAPEGFTADELKPIVEWAQKTGLDPKAAAAVALREKQAREKDEADFKHLSEKGWLEELQKDADLGGAKIRETMVDVQRAADRLSPKTQALIKEQGVLYNPVVVRILHDIGTKLREDTFVRPGDTPSPEQKQSLDERLASIWTKPNKA